jgi:hypothetical protein
VVRLDANSDSFLDRVSFSCMSKYVCKRTSPTKNVYDPMYFAIPRERSKRKALLTYVTHHVKG